MALALAAYSVTTYTAAVAATSSLASPSFSPAAGDVLYVVGFVDCPPNGPSGITENTPTNTGTGLSWSLVGRENTYTANTIAGSLFVWRAYNADAQTGITVSVNSPDSTSLLKCVAVIGFTGADSAQTGAAQQSLVYSAAATTPTLTAMTTTAAGSWCWMAGFNWTNYRSGLAAASGQSMQIAAQNPASAGDTIFLQKENPQPDAGRSSGTSVTMSDTGGTSGDYYHLVGWEILPAGGTQDATATPGCVAKAAAVPAVTAQAGTLSGPNYAGSAADLGGGSGSWSNTSNATGTDDGTVATWAVP